MSLPKSVAPQGPITVAVSGGEIVVERGLTWGELQRTRAIGAGVEADAFAVQCATGEPLSECLEWVRQATIGDVQAVLEAIFNLSGADEGARFPG